MNCSGRMFALRLRRFAPAGASRSGFETLARREPMHLHFDAFEVVWTHREDQVTRLDEGACDLLRAVRGEVEPTLESNEERAVGGRRSVPCTGACAGDLDVNEPALDDVLACERFGHRASAGVAGANEEQLHDLRISDEARRHFTQQCGVDRAGPNDARGAPRTIDHGGRR